MITVYKGPGGYSAATAQSLIAYNVSRPDCIAAIQRIGVPIHDCRAAVDNPADAAAWKSTLFSALANETQSLALLSEASADAALHSRVTLLLSVTEELRAELAAERERVEAAETRERERQAAAARERERQAAAAAAQAAAVEAEREAEKLKGVRVVKFSDGSVDVVRDTQEFLGLDRDKKARYRKYAVVLHRFKPGEKLPPEVEAKL
jgi:hypothetical protein